MKSFVYHVEIKVSDKKKSFKFYKDLFTYFGYKKILEENWGFGMSNGKTDFWIIQTPIKFRKNKYHRKNTGLNHIAFGVGKKAHVDKFVKDFLAPRKIIPLYDSPREYPEYEKGYYAVFFEDPDRIKLEVTFISGFEKKV